MLCFLFVLTRGAVGARVWAVNAGCLPRPGPSSSQSRFPLSR